MTYLSIKELKSIQNTIKQLNCYSYSLDDIIFNKAKTLTMGYFQQNILYGNERLSLATLQGKAKKYSQKYKISLNNFLERLTLNKIPWFEETGLHNKRVLIIGSKGVNQFNYLNKYKTKNHVFDYNYYINSNIQHVFIYNKKTNKRTTFSFNQNGMIYEFRIYINNFIFIKNYKNKTTKYIDDKKIINNISSLKEFNKLIKLYMVYK